MGETAIGPDLATGTSVLDELTLVYLPADLPWYIAYPSILLGLALSLLGYYMYRLVIALAAGVSGGALVFIFGPDLLALEGTALLTTSGGSGIILLVLGSFFYRAAVFVVGAGLGFGLGLGFWIVATGQIDADGLTNLSLDGWDRVRIVVGSLPAAIAIGLVLFSWERRLMTLGAVVLGAGLILFSLRYSGLPPGALEWAPVFGGIIVAVGLYLGARREAQPDQRESEGDRF